MWCGVMWSVRTVDRGGGSGGHVGAASLEKIHLYYIESVQTFAVISAQLARKCVGGETEIAFETDS